jgi:DNA-binding transcriptional regulator YdaS (Cro superfamily)
MFKSDVINFYGTKAKVAKAAGVDPSAVSQWQELVPEGRAMRLRVIPVSTGTKGLAKCPQKTL